MLPENTGPAASIEIGNPVIGGDPLDILYVDLLGNLGQSDAFTYNPSTNTIGVNNISLADEFIDSTSSSGTNGYLLSSTGTATKWVPVPSSAVTSVSNSDGTLTISPTTGSVVASIAALTSGKFLVGNGSNVATGVSMSGDATLANTGAVTLATVNTNTGSFGSSTAIPSFTVNGKGLITAASTNVVIAPAGTLSGTTLASTVVSSSLTSVGTLTGLTVTAAPTFSAMTQGSILFAGASGLLSQNNADFFWDNTNHRLGILTASPTSQIHIQGSSNSLCTLQTGLNNAAMVLQTTDANGSCNVTFGKGSGIGTMQMAFNAGATSVGAMGIDSNNNFYFQGANSTTFNFSVANSATFNIGTGGSSPINFTTNGNKKIAVLGENGGESPHTVTIGIIGYGASGHQQDPLDVSFNGSGSILRCTFGGNVSIGNSTAPAAWLGIKAGTTANAPINIAAGTNVTSAISGNIEYDGSYLYYTNSTPTRLYIAASSTLGYTGTITTAQLTAVTGTQGSMTFVNGVLTAQTAAT